MVTSEGPVNARRSFTDERVDEHAIIAELDSSAFVTYSEPYGGATHTKQPTKASCETVWDLSHEHDSILQLSCIVRILSELCL